MRDDSMMSKKRIKPKLTSNLPTQPQTFKTKESMSQRVKKFKEAGFKSVSQVQSPNLQTNQLNYQSFPSINEALIEKRADNHMKNASMMNLNPPLNQQTGTMFVVNWDKNRAHEGSGMLLQNHRPVLSPEPGNYKQQTEIGDQTSRIMQSDDINMNSEVDLHAQMFKSTDQAILD